MQTGPTPQPLPTDRLPRDIRAVRDAASYRPSGRTIVVCLDGTGDKFDNDNSNIVHLVGCLKKDDPGQVTVSSESSRPNVFLRKRQMKIKELKKKLKQNKTDTIYSTTSLVSGPTTEEA